MQLLMLIDNCMNRGYTKIIMVRRLFKIIVLFSTLYYTPLNLIMH